METPKDNGNGASLRLAFKIAADFGITLAVPSVVAALVGVRLDARFGTRPWLLVLCLIIAFALTGLWIVQKAKRYKALYEKI